ncbi:MAG: integrase family protein [Variovorax sp.]|nr:integrase family protein [Variovorax sp.]
MQCQLPFDETPAGEDLIGVFERWLADMQDAGALRYVSSAEVYRDMWGSFAAWCATQRPPVTLASLDARDLASFQAARFGMKASDLSLTPRHARRLLGLIDRVLRHHAAETGCEPNTAAMDAIAAQPKVRYANAAEADPLPAYLSTAQAARLITYLSRARPRLGADGEPMNWQGLRNRVAVALQLGAGLSPGDVRALPLAAPTSEGGRVAGRPWKLAVPGDGNSPARETPIAPWAGELLQYWLQVRATSGIGGDWLFPSTRSGKPWGKVAQYLAAKQVLHDAGIEEEGGGSFRLRHTFALRQLRRGAPPEQVARWLGVDLHLIGRYRRVLPEPAEVV